MQMIEFDTSIGSFDVLSKISPRVIVDLVKNDVVEDHQKGFCLFLIGYNHKNRKTVYKYLVPFLYEESITEENVFIEGAIYGLMDHLNDDICEHIEELYLQKDFKLIEEACYNVIVEYKGQHYGNQLKERKLK